MSQIHQYNSKDLNKYTEKKGETSDRNLDNPSWERVVSFLLKKELHITNDIL